MVPWGVALFRFGGGGRRRCGGGRFQRPPSVAAVRRPSFVPPTGGVPIGVCSLVCLSAVLASLRPRSSVPSPALPAPRLAFSFFCAVSLALSGAACGRLLFVRPARALSFSSIGGGGLFACCVAAAFFLWCFSPLASAGSSVAVPVFVGVAALPRSCPSAMRRRPCFSLAPAPLRLPHPCRGGSASVCLCGVYCHFVC